MNPCYILFIHLVINDMILLTLFGLIQVLSYILFTLNVAFCVCFILAKCTKHQHTVVWEIEARPSTNEWSTVGEPPAPVYRARLPRSTRRVGLQVR